MPGPIDPSELPAPALKALSPASPGPLRLMAAKAVLPGVKPEHLVTVLALLTADDDAVLAATAKQTLANLPPLIRDGALRADLQTGVIEALVGHLDHTSELIEQVLRLPRIGEHALLQIAERATEQVGELVATNETLLLAFPKAIEALYMNKRVRMSTADRVLELAVRNKLELGIPAYKEAALAIANELIPEASTEPTPDDLLFQYIDRVAEAAALEAEEDTHEEDEEGKEQLRDKFLPLFASISQMTITQKIRRAILGTSAERMLLVRDNNRLVASAAASSPMLNENEAARIASNRNVLDDVLRIIAQNRNFTRNYQVKLNLVTNPKTPLTFSARMVPHLRDNDLRMIAKSRNVAANIQALARQQLLRKQGG
jgi:hypothetical protein